MAIIKKFIIIFLFLCLFVVEIAQSKTLKYDIEKATIIRGKGHHYTISNNPIKIKNPKLSSDNQKKFIEKEFEYFKLKSKIAQENSNNVVEKQPVSNNEVINGKIIENKSNENVNNSNNNSNQNEDASNSYYIFGGGVVSIALVSVGFFNVYQRKRNRLFNLTKEELRELDKSSKMKNSYTSLSEEEKRFLHKINRRKRNSMKSYEDLTEEEILKIRKKNGWIDSNDEDCQFRRRKTNKCLSSNIKINNTNALAPRRASLNIKLNNNLLENDSCRKSCDAVEELSRKNSSIYAKNSKESLNQSSKRTNKTLNRKNLSIKTKDLSMPPIKMICTIVKNYNPVRPDEIELHLGDKVEIVNVYKDGWATGKVISNDEDGNRSNIAGYFPLAHASEPEIIDDNVNNLMIPSPLTPPINRSLNNSSFSTASPLKSIISNTSTSSSVIKSKNRHVSMVAISSSSSIHKQESQSLSSLNSTNSSIININNNINIIQHNVNKSNENNVNGKPNNINININVDQNFINNSISINSNQENENTPLINNNTVFFSALSTPTSTSAKRTSLMDPQAITDLLNEILKEEKMLDQITSKEEDTKKKTCHSQEVFDFLRDNIYNSKVTLEEKDYYRKCLERLRMSKSLDVKINNI